ncbi:MAG: NACHT domain-containing protein [Gammaproteobacteria bacterium]
MRGNKKLFLSAVSSEFVSYRNLLAADLERPNLNVAVQEDFVVTGGTTLDKLDIYIRHCDAVIHLIGKAAGAVPEGPAVAALLAEYPDLGARLPPLAKDLGKPEPQFSYTQWEAYLAIYHRRPLFVYRSTDFELDALDVPRDARFGFRSSEAQSQKEHYRRISALGHDRGQFLNEERLSSAVLRDLVEILPRLESTVYVTPTKLRHTAERLIGRDQDLSGLDAAWSDPHKNVVIVRAFGGMGKTSLVATWMAELALKNWRGAERVFDWSFYSQGTREQGAASADIFIAEALRAFGDPDPTLGSPWDRGARLASLVSKSRCLLVLDGLEPLQHPPGPMEGQLKDSGLSALLKGLAARNAGLCVVTTREKVDDIKQHYGRTADDLELSYLTDLAGAALLHYAGARRAGAMALLPDDKELRAANREVRGHGLTLQLLGRYLRLVEDGDIRKRDTVRLADADEQYQNDATRPYGHAFKAMEAYEKWFAGEGAQGQRQLAILRLLGLFDRPASKNCLDALRAEPVIAGLTEALVGLNPREWKLALSRLEEINLLSVQDDGSVDCHPLLREYFATQLRQQQPEAWRAAHRRLYEHLSATTKDKPQPTLEDLQPLYQAVMHGCQAGMQQEACEEVFFARIRLREKVYSVWKLGAFGSDLGAIACCFETPWNRLSPSLTYIWQAWLLNEAAFTLRALGRLTEALEPMRAGLDMCTMQQDWVEAAKGANNLSELKLTLGDVPGAVGSAERSVTYADRSGDAFVRMCVHTTHADALHQAARHGDAEARFDKAEALQAKREPDYPLLYSSAGFRYCDVLLSAPERAAWQLTLRSSFLPHPSCLPESCRSVSQRAAQGLKIAEARNLSHLTIALDHLTLGRAALYAAILEGSSFDACHAPLQHAVAGLRRAGTQHRIPTALLTRAWLRFLEDKRTGAESAQRDLDEAWEIAERGPMKLHMADIHLHRARLFFREPKYPWGSPAADLAAARELITKCGYGRRKEELEDAEAAARDWPGSPP